MGESLEYHTPFLYLVAASILLSLSSSSFASFASKRTAKPDPRPNKKYAPADAKVSKPYYSCSGSSRGKGNAKASKQTCPSWAEKSPVEPDTTSSVNSLKASQAVDVLFDGDSITAQLGVTGNGALKTYLGGASTLVSAVPGDTTGRMLWRWCQPGSFPKARVYVIGIGTNDLTLEPESIVSRHELIRDLIRAKNPKSSIIFTALWWRNSMLDRVDKLNSLLEKMVERSDSNVFYAPHTRNAATDSSGFLDGVHPNPASWNRALSGLAPCVRSALAASK